MPNRPPKLKRVSRRPRSLERPSAAARGYGRRWQKIRDAFLRSNPLCQVEGCDRLAGEVDHRRPLNEGGTHEWSNLRSLCSTHHKVITANYRLTGTNELPHGQE